LVGQKGFLKKRGDYLGPFFWKKAPRFLNSPGGPNKEGKGILVVPPYSLRKEGRFFLGAFKKFFNLREDFSFSLVGITSFPRRREF